MKIVYLVHQFYPEFQAGTEKFVFNMAYMSQKSGNKVKIITYSLGEPNSFPYRANNILYKEFHYKGLPILAYRYEREPGDLHFNIDPNADLNFAREILQQEKPDLIHVGHLMRVYPFLLAARQLKIPYLLTITDFHLLCPKIILTPTADSLCSGPERGQNCLKLCHELPELFITNRLNLSTEIIRDAVAVVAPSKFVAGIFEHEVDGLKVQINRHGIRQSNIRIRDQVYQAEDVIRFGYIGNLAIHKGVHVLVRAFTGIDSPRTNLSIYGSGQTAYTNQLKQITGNADVRFAGTFQPEDLSKVFDQIDVLVAPSICYETYSFVVHEALASEVPVITSDLGGMAEQIESEVNGFCFEAGNQQELQGMMQKIIDDPTILNKMKEHIRLETFVPSIEQEAYKYQQLYQTVTNG